ncbi:putative ABC transporter permease [Oscillibacter sp.]|uniref:putative ABC transporter permease n=1 Tax=Oscillibacter sp. TaxID=1945593 RepID=UPI00289789F1|nr:putative ABC transporter permease [Oscillibacter sp.]
MTLSEVICYFFFYSFLGWLYESLLCSIFGEHRFINRGFLLGPYCPIYGAGTILSWLVLRNSKSVFVVFLTAAVLCCALEYVTSYAMEKIFHARWWDYSKMPLNLHGRICLYGGVIFGGGIVLIRFLVQPKLIQLTSLLNENLLNGMATVLLVLLGTDIILTIGNWKGLNAHLSLLHNEICDKADGTFSKLTDRFWDTPLSSVVEKGQGLFIRVQNISVKLEPKELRFFKAFPNIYIPAHEEILKRLHIKEKAISNATKKSESADNSPGISVKDKVSLK